MPVLIKDSARQREWQFCYEQGSKACKEGMDSSSCHYSDQEILKRCAWMAGYYDNQEQVKEVEMTVEVVVFPADLVAEEIKLLTEIGIVPTWVPAEQSWQCSAKNITLGEISEVGEILGTKTHYQRKGGCGEFQLLRQSQDQHEKAA